MLLSCSAVVLAQSPPAAQSPKWQPAWPCTGKEPSFDPVFAKTAEATGGQLFLFDHSEAGRSLVLVTATARHPETMARSAGTLQESYRDFRVPG